MQSTETGVLRQHLGLCVEGDGVDVVADQGGDEPLHEAPPYPILLPGWKHLQNHVPLY